MTAARATLGDIAVDAYSVNTGPEAVAQVGPSMLGADDEFVTVNVRTQKVTYGLSCLAFRVRLRAASGEEYEPDERMRQQWPTQKQPSKDINTGVYAFRVRRGAKPAALIVEHDLAFERDCRAGTTIRDSAAAIGPAQVTLPLQGLGESVTRDEQGLYSARIGNLVVVLKGVTAARSFQSYPSVIRSLPGQHFVIAHLHIQNVGALPNCTQFSRELRADFGERIEPYWVAQSWEYPLDGLAPGRATDGDYQFTVKDDAKPYALVLVPQILGFSGCQNRFNPPIPVVDAQTVYIPLNTAPSGR
jgi:hypothetical protein